MSFSSCPPSSFSHILQTIRLIRLCGDGLSTVDLFGRRTASASEDARDLSKALRGGAGVGEAAASLSLRGDRAVHALAHLLLMTLWRSSSLSSSRLVPCDVAEKLLRAAAASSQAAAETALRSLSASRRATLLTFCEFLYDAVTEGGVDQMKLARLLGPPLLLPGRGNVDAVWVAMAAGALRRLVGWRATLAEEDSTTAAVVESGDVELAEAVEEATAAAVLDVTDAATDESFLSSEDEDDPEIASLISSSLASDRVDLAASAAASAKLVERMRCVLNGNTPEQRRRREERRRRREERARRRRARARK